MLSAPNFWFNPPGLLSFLLSPVAFLYSLIVRLRAKFTNPYRASVPIISVGNVLLGGAGKTPTTMSLARLLKERGYSPAIVSRGYGGSAQGPVRIQLEKHNFTEVGDEPLLLAQMAPTYVSKKRHLGVQMAEHEGADVILLDDGHQNVHVHKDINLLVVGGQQKFGNGKGFPAGPLREPVEQAIDRSQILVSVGDPQFTHEGKPVIHADIVPKPFPFAGKRVVAFCGLGFPQKFKESLLKMGCKLDKFVVFPDHYPYTEADMEKLMKQAYGIPLVTTAKDYVRVPRSYDHVLHVIEIDLIFKKPDKLMGLLT